VSARKYELVFENTILETIVPMTVFAPLKIMFLEQGHPIGFQKASPPSTIVHDACGPVP
jgi:hypothetical protein